MKDNSSQLDSDWKSEYQAAMLELDRRSLPQRIASARNAIAKRLEILAQDHFGTPEERQAIADALNGLGTLERELKNPADH